VGKVKLKVSGGFGLFDAYIPVTNRAITVAFDDSPSTLLVNLELDRMAPCAGRTAPTLTAAAATAVAAALVVAGVWRLRRRRSNHSPSRL
jgi:hypothetical protein